MIAWEKSKHDQQKTSSMKPIQKMKTFDQSNKSKKSLKKEAKKKAMAEAGGQESSNEDDTKEPEETYTDKVTLARENLKRRSTMGGSSKKKNVVPVETPKVDYDSDEAEKEYQRQRQFMLGPKK